MNPTEKKAASPKLTSAIRSESEILQDIYTVHEIVRHDIEGVQAKHRLQARHAMLGESRLLPRPEDSRTVVSLSMESCGPILMV